MELNIREINGKDWLAAKDIFGRRAPRLIRQLGPHIPYEVAKRFEKYFKWHIYHRTLDSSFPKLSADYLEWKKETGLDQRVFMARGAYIKSLEAKRLGNDAAFFAPDPSKAHHSGMNMLELAELLEQGSPGLGIPARPHWTPLTMKFQSIAPKIAFNEYLKLAKRTLGRKVTVGGRSTPFSIRSSTMRDIITDLTFTEERGIGAVFTPMVD